MKIGITGCRGRMGQMLVGELISDRWDGIELAGGSVLEEEEKRGVGFFVTRDAEELFDVSDAVIDFTSPESTLKHAGLAAEKNIPLVIGTTGLETADEEYLGTCAKSVPIVYAANMSVGVNLLLALVEQAAARLNDEWDIEIFETHHHHKVDAPSGTALALGKAVQKGRLLTPPSLPPQAGGSGALATQGGEFMFDRKGKRNKGDIGFAVQRGSDIVGEHTVTFFGSGERMELAHKATDRAIFARGAIRAALWAAGQKPGLYTMRDVLEL